MTPRIANRLRIVGAVALACALVACDDDQPAGPAPVPTPAPTPAPTPDPGTVISTGSFTLIRNQLGIEDFTTDRRGTIDVEVSYRDDSSHVLLWVTDRQCSRWQFERDECFYLTKSLDGPNPRRVTASGVPAGTYTLIVHNATTRVEEEVQYEILFIPE